MFGNLILDHELYETLCALTTSGATVTVIADTCHSANSTRGLTSQEVGVRRLLMPPMSDEQWATIVAPHPKLQGTSPLPKKTRGIGWFDAGGVPSHLSQGPASEEVRLRKAILPIRGRCILGQRQDRIVVQSHIGGVWKRAQQPLAALQPLVHFLTRGSLNCQDARTDERPYMALKRARRQIRLDPRKLRSAEPTQKIGTLLRYCTRKSAEYSASQILLGGQTSVSASASGLNRNTTI